SAVAAAASLLPVPERVARKGPGEFRLIGRPVPRLDLERQVTGQIRYGSDVREPEGALVAVLARCPVFGGTVRDFDPAPALAVPGVKQVIQVAQGVAVLAETTWQAMAGRSALHVEWNEGSLAGVSSEDLEQQLRTLGAGAGREAHREGSGAGGLADAAQVISAEYDLPFLAHACMEPMNCTALVTDQEVVVWVPTQNQAAPALFGGGSRGVAAKVAGVSQERVTVHTTNLGGGFGRRSETDFVAEAVGIAKAAGVSVRLV
ncbi:MAG: molybdopterin cofactor-binding domain-containing protein, partial [Gemmatimonadota bacterium]